MGGTYYRSPAPGEPPFVREGDKVEKGQTVAIIEAMKLMNEIEVPPYYSAAQPSLEVNFLVRMVTASSPAACGSTSIPEARMQLPTGYRCDI